GPAWPRSRRSISAPRSRPKPLRCAAASRSTPRNHMLPQLSRSPPPPYVVCILPVLTIMLLSGPAVAEAPVSLAAPGATLDEVLAIARRLSPELAARALDTEAAQARVAIAGSLADPTLRITSDEHDRTSGPRQNKMLFTAGQE